jgi:hypothetical protein
LDFGPEAILGVICIAGKALREIEGLEIPVLLESVSE